MKSMPFAAGIVPGFDLLQSLAGQAGKGLSSVGQWVAPTLDPQELDKRIDELRTVQFWLEQNAKLIGTTIQALEVQKMTLSTLQSMNLKMGDLQQAVRSALDPLAAAMGAAADDGGNAKDGSAAAPPAPGDTEEGATPNPGKVAVDPMQWWNALTEQFSQLAAQASTMPEGAAAAMKSAQSALQSAFQSATTVPVTPATDPAPAKPAARSSPSKSKAKAAAPKAQSKAASGTRAQQPSTQRGAAKASGSAGAKRVPSKASGPSKSGR